MGATIKAMYINESFIRERIVVPNGVDEKNILRAVRMAQGVFLNDVLGDNLYEALETHVVDGTITDAGNEDWVTLMEYVKEWLVYRTANLLIDVVAEGENLTDNMTKEGGLSDTYESAYSTVQVRMMRFIEDKSETFRDVITADGGYDNIESGVTDFPTFLPNDPYSTNYSNNCGK